MATKKKAPAKKRKKKNLYNRDVVYHWFFTHEGQAEVSFNAAHAAKAKGIPKDRKTWYKILKEENMRERYTQERRDMINEEQKQIKLQHQDSMNTNSRMFQKLAKRFEALMEKAWEKLEERDDAGLLLLRKNFRCFGKSLRRHCCVRKLYNTVISIINSLWHRGTLST